MDDTKIQGYKIRVAELLKVFRYQYGLKADLVNVNSQTVGTEAFNIMKTILEERNIAIEIDDRVAAGKFKFVRREMTATSIL
jgi:hypothetical protein